LRISVDVMKREEGGREELVEVDDGGGGREKE
jgi:hypothetical protein